MVIISCTCSWYSICTAVPSIGSLVLDPKLLTHTFANDSFATTSINNCIGQGWTYTNLAYCLAAIPLEHIPAILEVLSPSRHGCCRCHICHHLSLPLPNYCRQNVRYNFLAQGTNHVNSLYSNFPKLWRICTFLSHLSIQRSLLFLLRWGSKLKPLGSQVSLNLL